MHTGHVREARVGTKSSHIDQLPYSQPVNSVI